MTEREEAQKDLVGTHEERSSLGRPRRRLEDNIEVDLRDVGWDTWIRSASLRIGTDGGRL